MYEVEFTVVGTEKAPRHRASGGKWANIVRQLPGLPDGQALVLEFANRSDRATAQVRLIAEAAPIFGRGAIHTKSREVDDRAQLLVWCDRAAVEQLVVSLPVEA